MKYIETCNRILAFSFYSLFLFVPLVFAGDTSELFELNKMWFTFGVSAIVFAAWGTKMVLERKIRLQRTPLDIPIAFFLGAHIISTIISLDQSVSWWGYYSRFNGGLLSMLCYVLLYYAFVSNLTLKHVMTSLKVLLLSGLLTALWGFPSHFGADPTCLVFRGQLDTKCWTDAFQPTIRTFSTLGQPAWFAAFLAMVTPIAMAFALNSTKTKMWMYFSLAIFFYINLIFTDTRAGFLAFWVANILFWIGVFFRHVAKNVISKELFFKAALMFNISFLVCMFIFGSPIGQLYKFTLPHLLSKTNEQPKPEPSFSGTPAPVTPVADKANITDSGKIRLLVWEGAINAWKSNPIIGTGVETYAFAYYKYKPAEHNLTSEWDYLYNKAHNEYLNYLTTTGILGLGGYIAFIIYFFFMSIKKVFYKAEKITNHSSQSELEEASNSLLIIGILAAIVTILITNFFGFSVVIMNISLFLLAVFALMIANLIKNNRTFTKAFGAPSKELSGSQWSIIAGLIIFAIWMNIGLLIYRSADVAYALGNNLNKTGSYQEAYQHLNNAVQTIPTESVYKDELSINLAANAANLMMQKNVTEANQLAKQAIALSNEIVSQHPNNVVYWKNRVRLFYTLASADAQNQGDYYMEAVKAIDKAKELAPNDAKIAYNQGVLYGQTGQTQKAIEILTNTLKLRKDYPDALIALGLFYHQAAIDKNGKVVNPEMQQKAIDTYEYILRDIAPNLKEVKDSLNEWKKG